MGLLCCICAKLVEWCIFSVLESLFTRGMLHCSYHILQESFLEMRPKAGICDVPSLKRACVLCHAATCFSVFVSFGWEWQSKALWRRLKHPWGESTTSKLQVTSAHIPPVMIHSTSEWSHRLTLYQRCGSQKALTNNRLAVEPRNQWCCHVIGGRRRGNASYCTRNRKI